MLVCHMCVGAQGSQKRVHDPLELQLQVGLSHWIWLLRTKFESSTRAASILYHSSLSPTFFLMILNYACTYIYICMVPMYGFVHMSIGTQGGWKRVSEPLELELQAFVSHLI